MVFDLKNQYVIVDIKELLKYIKDRNIKDVDLQSLISNLEWNIILKK